ncbi:hypothetical protein NQ152_09820 [Microbacterium sp. zg.B48]|uniref:hypothetical protein n=1 Tax=Microbacterium sp. zg.B48 TaxID=2969408 RepID=UPI00214BF43C|nr:hypothetical protein [Microbacterium sp. zg.B48]MCR2763803.1 hypothetical protein [Microbacterium sp. zg.B48]
MGNAWTTAVKRQLEMMPVWPVVNHMEMGYVVNVRSDVVTPVGTFEDTTHDPDASAVLQRTATLQGVNRNVEIVSERSVAVNALAKGQASSVFPNAPAVNARIDVRFNKRDSAYGLATGIEGVTLTSPVLLIPHIQRAWRDGNWQPDHVFVYAIARAKAARFYAGTDSNTDFQLAADVDVTVPGTPVGRAEIAASLGISQQSKALLTHEVENSIEFFRAFRVRGNVLQDVGTFEFDPEMPAEDVFEEVEI